MYKPNLDKINKKLKSLGSGKYFKFTEGDNKFRILPPADGKSDFFYEITQHHGFSDGQRKRAYPCLEAMKARSCPACTLYRKAVEEGEKTVSGEIRPSTTYLMNVIPRGEDVVKILAAPPSILKSILTYVTDEEYGPEILDDELGRDFTLTREGTGFQTRYKNLRISPKPKPIGLDGWQDKLFDLTAEVEFKSFDDFVDAIEDGYSDYVEEWGLTFNKNKAEANEEEDEEDESEEDEEKPNKGSGKGKAGKPSGGRKSAKNEPEVDEEDSESDDEESPKPAKKGPKAKELEEEEDDIEEFLSEDEDEEVIEEEDEKPKKKGKRK